MALDRWIALVILAGASAYAYAAFSYALLPFERNAVFLPNTWPKVLSVAAILLSLLILVAPKPNDAGEEDALGGIDLSRFREYQVGQALGLIAAMVVYALALRPIGFLAATVLFLVVAGWVLGERRPIRMTAIAAVAAAGIWYLVDQALGVFLRPLPQFLA